MKNLPFYTLLIVLVISCAKDDNTFVSNDTLEVETRSVSAAITLIDNLIVEVSDLMANGEIGYGPGNSILSKLNSIKKKLEQGKTNVALSKLDALIAHMEELVTDGDLVVDIFNSLIVTINSAICETAPFDGDGDGSMCNVDCDDSNDALTDNCCPAECLWCELDYWTDDDCDSDYYDYDDYFCDYTYSWDHGSDNYCGCPNSGTGWATFMQDDDYYGNCEEGDKDYWYIYTSCYDYTTCCQDYSGCYTEYYYYNYDSGEYMSDRAYIDEETAQACAEAIRELAASIGWENQCEDYGNATDNSTEEEMSVELIKEHSSALKQGLKSDALLPEHIREMKKRIETNR